MPRSSFWVLTFALLTSASLARAQGPGWKCERSTTDRQCWACADVTFPFNRLCPAGMNPCDSDQICVRRSDDLCPVCFETTLDCCTDGVGCERPPTCERMMIGSTCSGDTCTYFSSCGDADTPYTVMCPPDAGTPPPDAGTALRDAGPTILDAGRPDAGDPGEDAGATQDAGAPGLDAGAAAPMDAAVESGAAVPPRFGGAGCRCRAAKSASGGASAWLLLLGLVGLRYRRASR